MESIGVYWRPVDQRLEGRLELLLVNAAQHMKTVPGRKTDVKDGQGIARLVEHGGSGRVSSRRRPSANSAS
jgi:hypothetical protein